MITWEEMNDNITKNFAAIDRHRYRTKNEGYLYTLSHIIRNMDSATSWSLTIGRYGKDKFPRSVQIGIL